MHAYSIDQLVEWFREGMTWYVLSLTPLRVLVVVPHDPPVWWYRWYSRGDWDYNSDDNWHPYPYLAWLFIRGVWRLLGEWIDESAAYLATRTLTFLLAVIGSLPNWAQSVAHGLAALFNRIGEGAVFWASNVNQGLQRLFDWLPDEIKWGGLSWSTLFEFVKSSVKAWIIATYDAARQRAFLVYDWVVATGGVLVAWYNAQHDKLQTFLDNPRAFIIAALGVDVVTAMTLARDIGAWLYNFKSLYSKDVGEFFADPGAWIVDRILAEVKRIW